MVTDAQWADLNGDGNAELVIVSEGYKPLSLSVNVEESEEMPEGTVLRELQRGYRIRDRVLRPSLVSVAKGGPPAASASGTSSGNGGGNAHHTDSHSTSHHAGSKPDSRE